MSLWSRLTGCECPVCRAGLPFGAAVRLLGDETATAPTPPPLVCPGCGTPLRAAGNGWDQTWRLAILYLPAPLLAAHLFGTPFGAILAVVLIPFAFRAVALEPAR